MNLGGFYVARTLRRNDMVYVVTFCEPTQRVGKMKGAQDDVIPVEQVS
jgi:hypothetical protein